jgi:multisubunit Na+/H+ antiporter MnhE subunit
VGDLLWALLIGGFVVSVIVLWVLCVRDIFTRGLSTSAKVIWLIAIVLFPVIGACIYLLTHTSASAMQTRSTTDPWYSSGGQRPPIQ